MKSVLIIFDRAYYEHIIATFNRLNCRGFTYWERVRGHDSKTGEPHYGSHVWSPMCSAVLMVVEGERVSPLLEVFHNMDKQTEQLGFRAFAWNTRKTT